MCMDVNDLQTIIITILDKVSVYKEKHIQAPLGPIDYVAIFPESKEYRGSFITLMKQLNATSVYSDNDGELYQLLKSVQTKFGAVSYIKICLVDSIYNSKRNKIGYVDYQVTNYSFLKEEYGKRPEFTFIHGDGWEILCLEQPNVDVSVYIPNIPLTKDLGFS
jgi:hypothetical protein